MAKFSFQADNPVTWWHEVAAGETFDLDNFDDSTQAPIGFYTNEGTPFTHTATDDSVEVSISFSAGIFHPVSVKAIPSTNVTQVVLGFNNIKGT